MPSLQVSVPGQGGDVRNAAGPGRGQVGRLQVRMQVAQILIGHPPQDHVLFHGGADVVSDVLAGNVRQVQGLLHCQVAQRQCNMHDRETALPLPIDVGGVPAFVFRSVSPYSMVIGWRTGCSVKLFQAVQIGGPAIIVGQDSPVPRTPAG